MHWIWVRIIQDASLRKDPNKQKEKISPSKCINNIMESRISKDFITDLIVALTSSHQHGTAHLAWIFLYKKKKINKYRWASSCVLSNNNFLGARLWDFFFFSLFQCYSFESLPCLLHSFFYKTKKSTFIWCTMKMFMPQPQLGNNRDNLYFFFGWSTAIILPRFAWNLSFIHAHIFLLLCAK